MIDVSELYKVKKDKHATQTPKLNKGKSPSKLAPRTLPITSKGSASNVLGIQRQEQIRKNNEQINKIIRQKKFYLKHKPIFDTVEEDDKDMDVTHSKFGAETMQTPIKIAGEYLYGEDQYYEVQVNEDYSSSINRHK